MTDLPGSPPSVDDLDDEAVGLLRRAYDANSLGSENMRRCTWRKDEAGDSPPGLAAESP